MLHAVAISDPPVGALGHSTSEPVSADLLNNALDFVREALAPRGHVSLTIADPAFRTVAATGPIAVAGDQAQYEAGDGPCVEACRSRRQVHWAMASLEGRRRLPDALRAGRVTEVISTPLSAPGVGSLNIYLVGPPSVPADHLPAAAAAAARHVGALWQRVASQSDGSPVDAEAEAIASAAHLVGRAARLVDGFLDPDGNPTVGDEQFAEVWAASHALYRARTMLDALLPPDAAGSEPAHDAAGAPSA